MAEGEAPTPHPENLLEIMNLRNFSVHPHSHTPPPSKGNIEVLRNLPLTSLDLYQCQKLEGTYDAH